MLSVIIPTYNEAENLKRTAEWVRKSDRDGLVTEMIVADGGSNDNTVAFAQSLD